MLFSEQLIQYILSGLSTGAIYALIGFGFAIIYNTTSIINFAQGEFVMLGGMISVYLLTVLNLPLPLAILGAIIAATAIGVIFERLAIRPVKQATHLNLVIITIGGSILMRGLAMLLWGKDTHAMATFSGDEPLNLAGATILPQHLWIFGITLLIIIGNRLFSTTALPARQCAPAPATGGPPIWWE